VIKVVQSAVSSPDFMTRFKAVTERPDRTRPLRMLLVGLATTLAATAAAAQKSEPGAASEARAQIVSLHTATLSSEMAGRIDSIATQVGDHFRKGDVLVTFDCAVPRSQLAREQAVVTQMARTYEINRRAVAQKSTGQLELDIAAADVLKAKADLAAAEAVASKCTIAAPFAGMTVEQKAHEFEYATPGRPVLDVLDDLALEVELTAPSRSFALLKPGAPFQVKIDDTGKTYSGQITRLGGRVDPASQAIRVIGAIIGDPSGLMAGMSGHVLVTPP
jgi:membrane fusion protein, multidrug efflux system